MANKVQLVDLNRLYTPLREQLHQVACNVIDSGHYVGGPEVAGFEKEMAAWLGVREICGVACATSGLFGTIKCMGIGPGDEVITTVHTAIATAEAISLTGAKVVFCDLKPGFFFLDPAEVRKKITPRTKALIPVHLYGQPVDLTAILELAREHQLNVIEDCAQSQGARYGNAYVGTLGDAAVFSFFPSKNHGGFGDGGAVTAKDPQLLRKIRMFSNHGRESKYLHEFEGINSRLDPIQAALLRVTLPHLDTWNAQRRAVAAWYNDELAGVKQIQLPAALPGTEPVYHIYAILTPERDKLLEHLKQNGVEAGVHYPYALNTLPAYAHLKQGVGSFPLAEAVCRQELSLPMSPVVTREEVRQVAAAIKTFYS